ncbi:MAG: DUF4185 domain-containing protein [Hyphomicrobiales bacterium]|nr:MAG: DUF4185 domain-containing protein [Hyphomicrobiales bacterium]
MRTALAALIIAAAGTVAHAAGFDVRSELVGPLTGPEAPSPMQGFDICGTDLGTMAEIDGRIVIAFGDTFGWRGDSCPKFGPNWRSNVIAFTTDMDPSDGVTIDDWLTGDDGRAIAAAEGRHLLKFTSEQTKIPTAMVAVGDTLYLHYMSVHGFADIGGVWICNSSRFISSADGGTTWDKGLDDFASHKSSFNMLALSAQPGIGNEDGQYVYAIGSACGRFGGARAARVLAAQLQDNAAWEYWDGVAWGDSQAAAAEIIKPGVGEGSLAWNAGLGKWMYTTLNELKPAIEIRFADRPEGPWSEAETLVETSNYDAAYNAYLTPSWISADGLSFHFLMSQFGPYNVYVMKATLTPR